MTEGLPQRMTHLGSYSVYGDIWMDTILSVVFYVSSAEGAATTCNTFKVCARQADWCT